MDNINETQKKKKLRRGLKLTSLFEGALSSRKDKPYAIFKDIVIFLTALVFARRHLFFGAHPLAIAMLAVMPSGVWVATVGAVIGSLTLGGAGFVYAIISAIVVFIRVVTSGSETKNGGAVFTESLLLRIAAALIGGFTAAIYEMLLSGFSLSALVFGLTMTLTPPALVFLSSGLFGAGIGAGELAFGKKNVFGRTAKTEKDKYNIIFFQGSAALLIFFVGYSLEPYSLLGISAVYLYAGIITLAVAKRFGALRAAAVGFFSVLGVSAMNSVAFALMGLVSGLLFSVAASYALVGGGCVIVAWCVYSGGFMTLLEVFPEYLISAVLGVGLLKRVNVEKTVHEEATAERQAKDMVGTMALSYRSAVRGSLPILEGSLVGVAGVVKRFSEESASLGLEDYKSVVTDAVLSYCKTCPGYRSCRTSCAAPYEELTDKIAEKLAAGERVSAKDFDTVPAYCHMSNRMFEVINEQAARAAAERFHAYGTAQSAVDLEMLSHLIGEALSSDERERAMNGALTEICEPIARELGPADCVIRVYGDRKYHVIAAGDDDDGSRITSQELRQKLEAALGAKLAPPEFFRSGNCVLMETDVTRSFSVECAYAAAAGAEGEVSGDTVRIFESQDDRFYALLSDGMGSGKVAKDTSTFVGAFLSGMLEACPPTDTVLRMLSHVIRSRSTECSATVDLFSLDLVNGEAVFLKSGAAPSYIKRRESIFRIRSETAPIGLMKNVDAERIRAGVDDGDYIIMLSDGISQSTEDAPWLLELLSKPPKSSVGEYADFILSGAVKNSKFKDDMTVLVSKIKKL